MYPMFRKRSSKDTLAIRISEEEHNFILEKERKFKELGIDVWSLDDRPQSKEYRLAKAKAIRFINNRQPVPAEIRDYLLKVKAQREKSQKS